MIDQANRTFICSVVFVDLVGYSKKSVAEQISLKERFQSLLAESIKDVAVNERIILDTGDGAAMSFLGDPEDALFVAMNLRDAMRSTEDSAGAAGRDEEEGVICIGINLGPVKLVRDINGHPNIIGDGINVAQRIMSFAKPGQVVVSRSYYDVVSVISEAYAKLFRYEGSRTDKHVREHEIYIVGESDDAFRQAKLGLENRAAQTNPKGRAQNQVGVQSGTYRINALPLPEEDMPAPKSFLQDTRKVMMASAGLGVVVLILIILVLMRKPQSPADPSPAAATAPGGAGQTAANAVPAPVAEPAKPVAESAKPNEPAKTETPGSQAPSAATSAPATGAAPTKTEPAKIDPAKAAEPAKAELPPGTLNLAVVPWGEVFVNGRSRGVSPPMKNLKLPPGKYRIEIKNTTFPPYSESVEIKSREEITVRHKF
ncbi:MAG: adenylate/guanylate cyclase domain-containing protein [Betaproteobacteria bacterium]|nr:adenylate/guanylate cyclase domain-containing protein [Betaproteobacteria bacterium]